MNAFTPYAAPVIRLDEARRAEITLRKLLIGLLLATGFSLGAAFTLTLQAVVDLDRAYGMEDRV